MPASDSKKSRLIEDSLAMIEARGGVPAMIERMDEFHESVNRMMTQRAELMREHPDKWVAMGKDGVLSIGESLEQVLEEVEGRRKRGAQVLIEFLDTDPPELIL